MSNIIITNMRNITPETENHPPYEYTKHAVTDASQKYEVASPNEGNQLVVAFYTVPPGKSSYPFHYHTVNEEAFYIISGDGLLETHDAKHPIAAGDIIVCPAGKTGAHKITNTSETENLIYLDIDTNKTPEIAIYPHSNKVGIRAPGGIRDNYIQDDRVSYYHNEPPNE